jgi:peptide/nickel transport system ATP-binding protein
MSAVAVPLLELRAVTKRFERKLDFAGRLAQKLGARVGDEIVHALDHVDLAVH